MIILNLTGKATTEEQKKLGVVEPNSETKAFIEDALNFSDDEKPSQEEIEQTAGDLANLAAMYDVLEGTIPDEYTNAGVEKYPNAVLIDANSIFADALQNSCFGLWLWVYKPSVADTIEEIKNPNAKEFEFDDIDRALIEQQQQQLIKKSHKQ